MNRKQRRARRQGGSPPPTIDVGWSFELAWRDCEVLVALDRSMDDLTEVQASLALQIALAVVIVDGAKFGYWRLPRVLAEVPPAPGEVRWTHAHGGVLVFAGGSAILMLGDPATVLEMMLAALQALVEDRIRPTLGPTADSGRYTNFLPNQLGAGGEA